MKFRPIRLGVLCLTAFAIAAPALAQELPNLREARRLVFAEDGAVEGEVILHDSLSETDVAILNQLVETQAYYAAIAIAPEMGLASEATIAAANYHDEANARTAALAACNEARTSGPACLVVLVIRPEGWEPDRPLQLSTDATAALRGDFRRLGRNRVMAISETTGQWGIGSDLTEALAACGETDCRAVIDG
ncbi:5-aminolevulic acid synthase [Alterinioella nitratireducens]|uniref:5-aminolevulic acid synthase n=1 Tax=Alterinioella nitratireducens TaxID=2735915 RepID=UPI00155612DC|nr:5-aminolevulic acid synthase [Alterinioella nitratireducens]NPD21123.1 5-aminolevulic acid synthase [Alterinioella nitratireducens]